MKSVVIAALILLGTSAQAQVYKCPGPDGKTTYSQAPCSTAGGQAMDQRVLRANTLPPPEARQQDSAARCKPDPTPVDPNVQQCKFAYHAINDPKGKALATDAKEECLQNMADRKACRPGDRREAYQMWKDHHDQMIGKRGSTRSINCLRLSHGMVCN